jgi:hypothetical protein
MLLPTRPNIRRKLNNFEIIFLVTIDLQPINLTLKLAFDRSESDSVFTFEVVTDFSTSPLGFGLSTEPRVRTLLVPLEHASG